MARKFWQVSVGDVIEYQVRSSANEDGPVEVDRVVHVGEIITDAPGFRLADGRVYLLSDLRMLRRLTAVAS